MGTAVESDTNHQDAPLPPNSGAACTMAMEVLTPHAAIRRLLSRIERWRAGMRFQSSQPLQLETPILLSGLPGGGSVTARVPNCLPLGKDGKSFLIGAALYAFGNG
jgi:hypothetical protein